MIRHPLPEPSLVQRLGGLLVLELALLAVIVLAGCGDGHQPTPSLDPRTCRADAR